MFDLKQPGKRMYQAHKVDMCLPDIEFSIEFSYLIAEAEQIYMEVEQPEGLLLMVVALKPVHRLFAHDQMPMQLQPVPAHLTLDDDQLQWPSGSSESDHGF
jgi:hypothetical protein